MSIDQRTFNQLIALFTPHFETLDQRRTLVGGAFFGTDVLAKVQLEGTPDEFTTRTVQMLIQHGEVESGTAGKPGQIAGHLPTPYNRHQSTLR